MPESPPILTLQPSGARADVAPDETLLDALLRADIDYPYGCKHGMCGACKGKLVSGSVDSGDLSDFALLDDEKAEGYVLLCSSYAKGDVVVEGPES